MSSNTPLINSTEYKNQYQEIKQNKAPSLDKSGYASKTKTELTEKHDSKKRSGQIHQFK